MDARAFLDQLLHSAKDLSGRGRDMAEQKLGVPQAGAERDAMLSGLGKGALAGGALALLLGTGAGRRLTGTALKLGGLAAVGGLAYQAYKNWQAGQAQTEAGTPINELTGPQAEDRSRVLLRAMIAAAKADGHIDDKERANIESQLARLGLESDASRFIQEELAKPLDVDAIAAHSDSPETAAEIYLASRLVIDVDNDEERAYLNKLTAALNLPSELVAQLEAQVGT